MPTIQFIKKKFKERSRRKKGNILEQPWSSALWEHLQDLPGERHRTDQCRFKACDEEGNPILKPTGLQSDFLNKQSIARCGGHHGRKHGWLQGAVGGKNRTTMAAVYPESMCKALVKDVKRFLDYRNTSQGYYKCEPCAMDRAATADMEHNFLPGEFRYGKWPKAKIQESAKDLNENNNRKMTSLTASERKRSRTRRSCKVDLQPIHHSASTASRQPF